MWGLRACFCWRVGIGFKVVGFGLGLTVRGQDVFVEATVLYPFIRNSPRR